MNNFILSVVGNDSITRKPYQDYFLDGVLVAQAFSCTIHNRKELPLSLYPFGDKCFPLTNTYHLALHNYGVINWFYDLESYSELADKLYTYYSPLDIISVKSGGAS